MTQSRTSPPRGILSWVRRRVLPKASKLCALLGLLILIAWITGRVVTDAYRWSQYLWWVPAIWMIGSAWLLLIFSGILALFARRLGGLFLRPMLLLACIGCTGYLIFGVWHMHRALLPKSIPNDALRIAHWNQAAKDIDQQAFGQWVLDEQIDIALIANARWGKDRQTLLDALAGYAPLDRERWVNYSYRVHAEPSHFWIQDQALIASRFPMIRTGKVEFGSADRQPVLNHSSSGRGWVSFIEFDLSESDSSDAPDRLIVWFVDLPSDPYNFRQESMSELRNAIDQWDGSGWAMGKHVWEQQTWPNASFPEPDLIVGDFNTIRGSNSLDRIASGMTDAFEAVGYGRARSWTPGSKNRFVRLPIKLADWQIDLSLVGKNWEPVRYFIENGSDWGWSAHRVQIVEIAEKTHE
jgi:hypothetical protein